MVTMGVKHNDTTENKLQFARPGGNDLNYLNKIGPITLQIAANLTNNFRSTGVERVGGGEVSSTRLTT